MLDQQPHRTLNILVFSCLVAVVLLQIPLVQGPREVVDAEPVTGGSLAAFEEGSSVEQLVETTIPEVVEAPKPKYKSYATYQVQTGDSLYWIAATYGISVQELMHLNHLDSEVIRVGQRLAVPTDLLKYYPVGIYLSNQEVEWLAQMIYAEARGEPYIGQVAVGAVIINRILSPQFPNTLRGVLFQNNAFQPIRNGSFYMTPNESARRAALEALNGHDPTGGALYFFNPRQSSDRFMHSRPAKITIGSHRFTN
ncbi:MAG: LysM peptidoglycan-binding domain-containing protein [Firmicutes bacterium]|nr:LysM peptidoglycan-binding domain-containing protein [Bacillota bacterium]